MSFLIVKGKEDQPVVIAVDQIIAIRSAGRAGIGWSPTNLIKTEITCKEGITVYSSDFPALIRDAIVALVTTTTTMPPPGRD